MTDIIHVKQTWGEFQRLVKVNLHAASNSSPTESEVDSIMLEAYDEYIHSTGDSFTYFTWNVAIQIVRDRLDKLLNAEPAKQVA